MPSAHIINEVHVDRSARVMQMESLFDVPAAQISRIEWRAELPIEQRPWSIGLIVGPSGAGKSSLLRSMWPSAILQNSAWDASRSVLDAFPDGMSIKTIVGLLNSVGFSSPPSWVRPYAMLSTGEQFRVMIARAMAERTDLICIDEFSSVVDRQVAQVASHTIQKAIRKADRQLIASTCHYDVLDWLQPDWIYQPHLSSFQWRSVQPRPAVDFTIHSIDRAVWSIFRQYHYMNGDLHKGAQCFGGFVNGELVAFSSYLHFPHADVRDIKMGHRLVVHPDWQGLGIGGRFDDWMGEYLHARGFRYHNVVAHPAMIAYYNNSPRWKLERSGRATHAGKTGIKPMQNHLRTFSMMRSSASFEYVPLERDYAHT